MRFVTDGHSGGAWPRGSYERGQRGVSDWRGWDTTSGPDGGGLPCTPAGGELGQAPGWTLGRAPVRLQRDEEAAVAVIGAISAATRRLRPRSSVNEEGARSTAALCEHLSWGAMVHANKDSRPSRMTAGREGASMRESARPITAMLMAARVIRRGRRGAGSKKYQ